MFFTSVPVYQDTKAKIARKISMIACQILVTMEHALTMSTAILAIVSLALHPVVVKSTSMNAYVRNFNIYKSL